MIVREIMTTNMITIAPDDTLGYAANLLRQYQFHHLPVVRRTKAPGAGVAGQAAVKLLVLFEGLITSQDIELAVALGRQRSSGDLLQRSWQEQFIGEVMHRPDVKLSPTTSVASAAKILVERGMNCLPVVEYEQTESGKETRTVLVGLLTRSDLLMAFARSMGIFEPGMQLVITLPGNDLTPLAQTLLLAHEMHIKVLSVLVTPQENDTSRAATLRLGTINPSPMLLRLQAANISYRFADPLLEGDTHA
ncbi:MAG: acetoin utilization AcuB family protein [Ktedonobacteraceae bacterium]